MIKYKYCFLNSVYEDDNSKSVLYELILADEYALNLAWLRLDILELKKLSDSDNYVTDFTFEEEFLLCNKEIARVQINNLVKGEEGKLIKIERNPDELQFIIYDYLVNDVIYLPESVITSVRENGTYLGSETNNFSSIRFSRTTMSVYFTINNCGKIYNDLIVKQDREKNILNVNTFYVGVPLSNKYVPKFSKFECNTTINNQSIAVYSIYFIPLFCALPLVNPLVNKINVEAQRNRYYVDCMQEVLGYLKAGEVGEKEELEWIGGEHSYAFDTGVFFESTEKLTKKEIQDIFVTCINSLFIKWVQSDYSFDYQKVIDEMDKEVIFKLCMTKIMQILTVPVDTSEDADSYAQMLGMVLRSIKSFSFEQVMFDSFIYELRATSFMGYRKLINANSIKIIQGSDVEACTIIKERLFR